MAFPRGLEPPTYRLGGGRSIQLSYGNIMICCIAPGKLLQIGALRYYSIIFLLLQGIFQISLEFFFVMVYNRDSILLQGSGSCLQIPLR